MDWRVQLQIKAKLLCCSRRFLTGSFWVSSAWKSLCWKPKSLKQSISALLCARALHLGYVSPLATRPKDSSNTQSVPLDSLLLAGEGLLDNKACVSLPLLGTYLSAFLSANRVRRADIKEYEILEESFEICTGLRCVEKGLRPLAWKASQSPGVEKAFFFWCWPMKAGGRGVGLPPVEQERPSWGVRESL